MPRALTIDLSKSLPPRARPLTDAELDKVFGGCGGLCKETRDCSCGRFCYGFHAGYRMGTCMS